MAAASLAAGSATTALESVELIDQVQNTLHSH